MSEADTPNTPSSLPEPIEQLEAGSSSPAPELEEAAPVEVSAVGIESRLGEMDWYTLTQKLRQRNRDLLAQAAHLDQALKECQEALQAQIERSHSADNLLTHQASELANAQEQLSRLFHELESSHQAAHRQQILIETLTEQLESSQERVAQLERECALVQQFHNEQSHQLLQTENTARELRSRLHRQQRHTLQFKAALEKCLEVPTNSYECTEAQDIQEELPPPNPKTKAQNRPPLPKAQPIQPWSAQLEASEMVEEPPDWLGKIPLEPNWELDYSELDLAEIGLPDSSPESEQLLVDMPILAEASRLLNELEESEAETPVVVMVDEEQNQQSSRDNETPSSDAFLPQPNWPSPVVYPLRPSKKLKSLAAIDLPTFPRPSS